MSYYNSILTFELNDGITIPIEPLHEKAQLCSPRETINISSRQWNKFAYKKYNCRCCHNQLEQWEVNENFRAYFVMGKTGKTSFKCFYCTQSCYETCRHPKTLERGSKHR